MCSRPAGRCRDSGSWRKRKQRPLWGLIWVLGLLWPFSSSATLEALHLFSSSVSRVRKDMYLAPGMSQGVKHVPLGLVWLQGFPPHHPMLPLAALWTQTGQPLGGWFFAVGISMRQGLSEGLCDLGPPPPVILIQEKPDIPRS